MCHEEHRTPLVSKRQVSDMKFRSLSSTFNGDGEIFLEQSPSSQDVQNQKQVLVIVRFISDHNLNIFFRQGTSIPDPPNYRTEVSTHMIKCDEDKFGMTKLRKSWNASNELVRVLANDPAAVKFSEFQKFSLFATLQEIVCGKGYTGVGIRWGSDNGSLRVTEVFAGSPAEKSGIKTNDVVTKIDNEAISGLTPQQIIEKVRGPANTSVVLTLLRKGQDNPFDLTITREVIQLQPTQGGPPK